jgi:hypothetical protein
MNRCPCCDLDLTPKTPRVGEVWMRVESGVLYRITEEYRAKDSGFYGGAERIRPPRQGCDLTFMAAVWPSDVNNGDWLRVMNPSSEDLRSPQATDTKEGK